MFSLPLMGQTFSGSLFNRPTRKAMQSEIDNLRTSLDSLQQLVDSLEERHYLEDNELLAVIEGNGDGNGNNIVYTPEVSDSLLHLWYKNSLTGDFDAVNEFDMDSVRFSSNVSDEEMIRRLTNMNSFISLPFNSNVKNYIILYSERMTTRMGRVMGLSAYYFPLFEEVLDRYGLPVELKYMAVIESMLNPVATSRAGARGIWQFMYNTGRNYGLEINSYVDERLDVEKAMDAAARYLRDSYKIFGDWALAISSYNCGAGNVSKAIRRAGSRDFWSIYPYLPRETRGYVPAFVGAMYAMTYYKEYGIVPQNVGMPAQTDTFEIRQNLHFRQINEVVGVPMDDLKNLNPQYSHEIIPASSSHPYTLKLPYTWTAAFVDADRDSLYSHKADSLFSSKVIKEIEKPSSSSAVAKPQRVAYKVKSGDYLGKIASRYGVSVSQIKSWNNLRSSNIRVGQILYIYGGKSSGSGASSSKAATTSQQRIYTVKSGDSLYTIAKRYPGVSAGDIKKANGLTSDKIRPGQKLKIPQP